MSKMRVKSWLQNNFFLQKDVSKKQGTGASGFKYGEKENFENLRANLFLPSSWNDECRD